MTNPTVLKPIIVEDESTPPSAPSPDAPFAGSPFAGAPFGATQPPLERRGFFSVLWRVLALGVVVTLVVIGAVIGLLVRGILGLVLRLFGGRSSRPTGRPNGGGER